jgi:hypothetical protein
MKTTYPFAPRVSAAFAREWRKGRKRRRHRRWDWRLWKLYRRAVNWARSLTRRG